ncbi:CYTH domain-containing protein [Brevifollis gellanilyticus]|uniref:CYTH domain-containing protein n=1 Tax=Brevifollis gellanilyticus TaxID=748831 RepID=A0A512MH92_9BACT|nr:CYTH domain-containing protein [Brevifollis gellanilyticus]GEP46103.1 CYTH domain-containing protein [Brevifollis gellanilyticus]
MPVEIERKFLVTHDAWREGASARRIAQGYLSRDPDRVVRVRLIGDQAFVTIKGRRSGISRAEFEYPVPVIDAEELLKLCLPSVIDKTRHEIEIAGFLWEIDEFHGSNAGLIVAEIELPAEDTPFERPSWLGEEVSSDSRYTNSYLSGSPYSTWAHDA